jgi:hypothetical protein
MSVASWAFVIGEVVSHPSGSSRMMAKDLSSRHMGCIEVDGLTLTSDKTVNI